MVVLLARAVLAVLGRHNGLGLGLFYSCFYFHVCIIVYSYIRVMVHMHLNTVLESVSHS
jgi:hypothetical protein